MQITWQKLIEINFNDTSVQACILQSDDVRLSWPLTHLRSMMADAEGLRLGAFGSGFLAGEQEVGIWIEIEPDTLPPAGLR